MEFLKIGDIFSVGMNFKLEAYIPDCYYYSNKSLDTITTSKREIDIGEIIEPVALPEKSKLYLEISKCLEDNLGRFFYNESKKFVNKLDLTKPDPFDTKIYLGDYVVLKVDKPYNAMSTKITASRLDDNGKLSTRIIVYFNQGGYIAPHHDEDIKVLGKYAFPVDFNTVGDGLELEFEKV